MKKIILLGAAVTILTTSVMADVKPYIGLGFTNFSIHGSNNSAGGRGLGNSTDSGSTISLNGGAILNDNAKINFSYFSGTESDSKLFKTTVTAISYEHSFNNTGIRKGVYIGAGISNVKTEIDKAGSVSASESKTGLLLKVGYEHPINDNVLLNIGYTSHFAKQDLKFRYQGLNANVSTKTSNLNASINYIF